MYRGSHFLRDSFSLGRRNTIPCMVFIKSVSVAWFSLYFINQPADFNISWLPVSRVSFAVNGERQACETYHYLTSQFDDNKLEAMGLLDWRQMMRMGRRFAQKAFDAIGMYNTRQRLH